MGTIDTIELHDKDIYPDEAILKAVLGEAYDTYFSLLNLYDENGMTHEWRYYNDGKTWLCKVQKDKRTIVWMSAWKGYTKATIYFPEKHIEDIYTLDLSEATKEKIRQTKNTGKSKPCIFEIQNNEILNDFNKVMQFKLTTK